MLAYTSNQPAPVYPTATTSKETHRHHFQSPASLLEAAFPSAAAMPPAPARPQVRAQRARSFGKSFAAKSPGNRKRISTFL